MNSPVRDLFIKHIEGSTKSKILFYLFAFGFIALNAWLVLKKDTLLGIAIPVVLLILFIAFYSYDKLIWIAVFFTPMSIPLKEILPGVPFDMLLPTEPIIFGVLLVFIIALISGKRLPKSIVRHPISIAIYIYLLWMLITVLTSTMPLISIKFFMNRLWYIVGFYFLAAVLFQEHKNMDRYVWTYVVMLVPIIFYTISRHLGYGLFDKQAAHFVMTPFFNDHTSYGAILAFYIPFFANYAFSSYYSPKKRVLSFAVLTILIVAIILSYTRAAWLSLFLGCGVWVLMRFKVKFKTIVIVAGSLVLAFFAFRTQIIMKMEQNSQESSSNLSEHLSSMTNISSDASNLERINRWSCAIRMFEEKPVCGWGPGTYAMQYAPFQLSKDRTIISTNSGDGGNAHSEYLGAMAESGIMGMMSFAAIIILTLCTGINSYQRIKEKHLRNIIAAAIVGLTSYYIHAFLNNFLDTDKAAVPFWGFTAIIVTIDILSKNNQEKNLESDKKEAVEAE